MQEENKFSYRSLNQSKEKEWHFARGLNDITTAGNYAVRLYHDDLEAIGISTAECDTEHYVVAHLVVIESAATGKQQKMRTVGQTLMFTTCTNQNMKIITRICVLTPDGVVWHPWVDSKAGTDYLPTAQELNTTVGHLDNKFVYKGTNDVDIVSGGYFDKTANDITLNLKKWGDTTGLGRARHTIAAATEAMAGVMSAEDKKKLNKAEVVTKVEWGVNSNINDYTSSGVYYITGKRSMSDDGLPIDTYPYFTARLLVVSSTENSNSITQILSLNASGESNLFLRTCVLGDTPVWSKWGKLQQNTNVGRVASLDNFTAGGVYSGIYTGGTSHETFVLTVINNEAAAKAAGSVLCISQFKYALDLHSNYSYKTRTGRGDSVIEWGVWVDLVAADTTDIQDGAITAQKLSTSLQEQINQNTANATKAANGAYWTSGPNAVTLNINKNDGTVGWQTLPAATTEKAGVVTAEDKINMEKTLIVQYGRNLFIKDDATVVGLLDTNANLSEFTDWRTTAHYVNIMPNTKYKAKANVVVAIYDADKNFINRSLEQTDYELTTPANACYARFSVYDYQKSTRMVTLASEWNDGVYEEGVFPAVNTVSGSPFVLTSGKFKIATLGDSITYGGNWQRIISRLTGCTFFNNGLSGKTISSFVFHRKSGTATDYDRILTAEDFEGCDAIVICGYANSLWGNMGSMETDYITINADDANADIQNYPSIIGQNGYIGALRSVIEYLMRICPEIPIIISGQLPMSRAKEGVGGATNSVDFNRVYDYSHKTCAEFSEATKMVAEYYHLPYVDMEKQGQVNILNYSSYYNEGDTTHPNFKEFDNLKNEFPVSGSRQMALLILDALRKVIPL